MPTYKSPRHGVSLSEAQHEAAAVAPIDLVLLNTFELWHPLGTPEGPIYTVKDSRPLLATKEAGAARDPGLQVEFLAARNLEDTRPAESDTEASPELSIKLPNISGLVSAALKRARGSRVQWQLIERVYAANDTSAPHMMPPLLEYLSAISLDAESATLRASYADTGNVSIPRLTFNRREHPGLVR